MVKFDDKFRAAVGLDFVRLSTSEKAEMASFHNEAYGHEGNIRGGCNRCVLTAVKRLGKDYLADKKEYEELAKIEEQVVEEQEKEEEQIPEEITKVEDEQIPEEVKEVAEKVKPLKENKKKEDKED